MSDADVNPPADVAARIQAECGLADEQLDALLELEPNTWQGYTSGVDVPTVEIVERMSDLLGYWPAVMLGHFGYKDEAVEAEARVPTAAMEQRIATASRKRRERMTPVRRAVCRGGEADGTELDIRVLDGILVSVTGAAGASLLYRVTSAVDVDRVVLDYVESGSSDA